MISSAGSSMSRTCFRLTKWIEPGIRLAWNIQSSKQFTSLKSRPRSSFSFSSSRVIVFIYSYNIDDFAWFGFGGFCFCFAPCIPTQKAPKTYPRVHPGKPVLSRLKGNLTGSLPFTPSDLFVTPITIGFLFQLGLKSATSFLRSRDRRRGATCTRKLS